MKVINSCISFLLLTFLLSTTLSVTAQSKKDFFASPDKKATWLGLDFTDLKIFGDTEADVQAIKDQYFVSINDLVLTEPDKYDVAKAFRRTKLVYDLTEVTRLNAQVDSNKLIVLNSEEVMKVTPERVQELVSAYQLTETTGYGIVFIMEAFNKSKKVATMYVTVIDMASKKVLLTKRMEGKASGFGYRNYWARTVYEVLNTINSSAYNKWKAETN